MMLFLFIGNGKDNYLSNVTICNNNWKISKLHSLPNYNIEIYKNGSFIEFWRNSWDIRTNPYSKTLRADTIVQI